jgi:chromosome partitioning protein
MTSPKRGRGTRKVAVANQKGGVGKSTSVLNIAVAAVELGGRVLIRDMDAQANVTAALCPEGVEFTMNDLLKPDETTKEVVEGSLASAIRPAGPQWPKGLYVVAASMSQSEREHDQVIGREARLRSVSVGALDAFDLVLSDCPPNVGQLTINALTDSEQALIISEPEIWSIQGVHEVVRTIKRVTAYYNPVLTLGGILVNGYQRSGGRAGKGRLESQTRLAELKGRYGDLVLPEVVNSSETIRKAVGAKSPLSAFGAEGRTHQQLYQQIATRILNS